MIRGVVLVGGSSRRMGRRKSELRLAGMSLLERSLRMLRPMVRGLAVAGGHSATEGLAGVSAAQRRGVTWLADTAADVGPLGGLLAALAHDPAADWLCVACDMPAIRPDAVAWLLKQHRPGADATLARLTREGAAEPFPGIYAGRAGPILRQALRKGVRSMWRAIERLNARIATVPPRLEECWYNVNTPEEWRAARRNLLEAGGPGTERRRSRATRVTRRAARSGKAARRRTPRASRDASAGRPRPRSLAGARNRTRASGKSRRS